MKKLFVSVPMRNRTEEDIKLSMIKMHGIAERYTGEKLELIDSFIYEEPPMACNTSLWYLGKSLEKLAMADVFIGIDEASAYSGCLIENLAAENYNIKSYYIPLETILSNNNEGE